MIQHFALENFMSVHFSLNMSFLTSYRSCQCYFWLVKENYRKFMKHFSRYIHIPCQENRWYSNCCWYGDWNCECFTRTNQIDSYGLLAAHEGKYRPLAIIPHRRDQYPNKKRRNDVFDIFRCISEEDSRKCCMRKNRHGNHWMNPFQKMRYSLEVWLPADGEKVLQNLNMTDNFLKQRVG